ncbi:MAG: MFS transporter [Pyrobaculum sp.]
MKKLNLATFLYFTANGIAIVAIPPYLRDLGVVRETFIGFIVSTAFLISVIARPLSGILGDRVGYVKIMKLGAAAAVGAQIMYLFSSPLWVQIGRVFHGLSIAMFLPMSIAMSVTEGVKSMASRSLAVGLGNVAGPLLGTLIYDMGGARTAFLTALALHCINWFLINGLEDYRSRHGVKDRVEKRVFLFMTLLTIYAAVYMGLSTFILVKLRDLGLSLTLWGVFTTTAALSSLVPRAIMAKKNLVSIINAAAATATAAFGLLIASTASNYIEFIVAGIIFGVGQGALVTSYQILALAQSKRAGLASSIYTMGWDLGSIIGPVLGGVLVESLGYSVLYILPVSLFINVAVLFIYRYHSGRGFSSSPS